MRLTHARILNVALPLALMLVMASISSCDPNAIAPLPTPVSPDNDRIITSSLTAGEATEDTTEPQAVPERLVAIVGLPGAVAGDGEVLLVNQRTGLESRVPATGLGTFSAALFAVPSDIYALRYVSPDGAESDAIEVGVTQFDPGSVTQLPSGSGAGFQSDESGSKDGDGTMGDNTDDPDASPPPAPGTSECETPPCEDDASNATDQPPVDATGGAERQTLALIWSIEDGALRLQAQPGTLAANSNVIISNSVTGAVQLEAADANGGLNVTVQATPGDVLLIFTQAANDPDATSPAQQFTVPQG